MSFYGKVNNSNTRTHATGSSELDTFKSDSDGGADVEGVANPEDVEYAVVGSSSRTPGDLVEIKLVP